MVVHTFRMINGDWQVMPCTPLLKGELMYAEKDLPTRLEARADKKYLELWYHESSIPPKEREEFARKTAQMALSFLAKYARATRKGAMLLTYDYKFQKTV